MSLVAERGTSATTRSVMARKAMIDSQLRVSGVNEALVLAVMEGVAREDFVPEQARTTAYVDRAIPLGNGKFLAAPLVHGHMLAEAAPSRTDSVLVVDGGSGYLPALLNQLCDKVEVIDAASGAAPGRKKGNFTLLIIDGAIEQLPASLASRLAEGARVVTGLVSNGVTRLAVGRKLGGDVSLLQLAEIGIPVLAEFNAPKSWKF